MMTEPFLANFHTIKHISGRKICQIVLEVKAEDMPNVIGYLGNPGYNNWVAVAKVDISAVNQREETKKKTDAVVLESITICKDRRFQDWCASQTIGHGHEGSEEIAARMVYGACQIKSRSELANNHDARTRFYELLREFHRDVGLS